MNKFLDNNFETLIFAVMAAIFALFIYNLLTLVFAGLRKILRSRPGLNRKEYRVFKFTGKITSFNKKAYILMNLTIILCINILICLAIYPKPKIIHTTPGQNGIWSNPESNISVKFSRPIKTKNLQIYLAPEVAGQWHEKKTFSWLPFVTEMEFEPAETITPGEDAIIYVVGYNPKTIGETMIEFKSPTIPKVSSINVEQTPENFPLDGNIEISLDNQLSDSFSWRAEISPETEVEIKEDRNANKLIITPKTRLKISTQYTIKLFMSKVSYKVDDQSVVSKTTEEMVKEIQFKTDSSTLIKSVSPEGNMVMPDTQVKIVLDREIDQNNFQSKFMTEPTVKGTSAWTDKFTFTFKPDAVLEKATKYKIIIDKGIKYSNGIETKEPLVFDFETIGYVKVNKFNISSGATYVGVKSGISVEFNQEVDKTSAQNAFSISPNAAGSFSWSGNKMVFKPKSTLAYFKSHTVTIKAGVKSIKGLDSKDEFKVSFKTEPDEYLNTSVPYYRQSNRFECELLALRMALAYRGVYMSANQIMREIGVSTVPYNSSANTWGDPNVSFVGDVTGASKGYGVHLDPLARVARSHGRSATVHRGWNASALVQEVRKGNPVIILWQNGWSAPTNISWNTPEGKRIYAINGTHAGVVVGYKGPSASPTSIIVQDPWYRGGSRRTYSISSFNSLWNIHGKSALVVY